MKGIILSAGSGTRLLPLTRTMPKCLVDVGGRSILDHQLDALATAQISEAIVVVGYRGRQVRDHLAATPPPLPVTIVDNPFWSVSSSIGSVWAARASLDEAFCLMNGDTVFAGAIIAGAIAQAAADVSLLVEPIIAAERDDMLVAVDHERVTAVAKTLDPALVGHRSLGVIISTGGNRYRQALDAIITRDHGLRAYHHDIVNELAQSGSVAAIVDRHGGWQEIDRPADIERWKEAARPVGL